MDENHKCICEVCTCMCTLVYKRHEHKPLSEQTLREKNESKKKTTDESKSKFICLFISNDFIHLTILCLL